MTASRCTLLAVVTFLCVPVAAADDPKDDPLPKGAKLRLGSSRLAFRSMPSGVLLPPDYKTFLVPDTVNGFRRFDVATGKQLGNPKPGGFLAGAVVVSGNGRRVVSLTAGALTVRDTDTGKTVSELKPPAGFATFPGNFAASVSFSGDGRLLAQGGPGRGGKGEVLVWDVDKSATVAEFTLDQQRGGVVLPVLSFDGKLLATRNTSPTGFPGVKDDEAGAIRVWDVGAKKELFKVRVTPSVYSIAACAFSPDGLLLAASCADGPVDLWDVKTGKSKATLLGRTGQGSRLAFSTDSKTLAAMATDGAIQRWSTETGKALGTTEQPAGLQVYATHGMTFADRDRVIVWGGTGSAAFAWEAPGGKLITQLGEHTSAIKSIGFAEGGKTIVTSGLDWKVVKWDGATGKTLGPVAIHAPRSTGLRPVLTLAPDAGHGINAGPPAAVIDLKTGAELFAVPRSSFVVPSADAERVVALTVPYTPRNATGTAAVWDLATRKKTVEVELAFTPGYIPHAAVSPSGDRFVVARYTLSADGSRIVLTVTGFDAKTSKKLGEVEDNVTTGPLFAAAADEKTVLVWSLNGRLRAFNYEEGKAGEVIEPAGHAEPGGGVGAGVVVFSPDGKRFATGVATESPDVFGVRVYDWPGGKALHTFTGHRGPVTALTFSPDGKSLASGSSDTSVLVWDLSVIGKK